MANNVHTAEHDHGLVENPLQVWDHRVLHDIVEVGGAL
jgi:hypothetical protein